MPFKHHAARRHQFPRATYRVTNWAAYEASLRQRGSLTIWFCEEAIQAWRAAPRTTRGGQPRYSAVAIERDHAELLGDQAALAVAGTVVSLAAIAGYHAAKVSRRVPSSVRVRICSSR